MEPNEQQTTEIRVRIAATMAAAGQVGNTTTPILTVNTSSSSSSSIHHQRSRTWTSIVSGEETSVFLFTPDQKRIIPCCTPSRAADGNNVDVCGVCLSPLPKSTAVVTTKCKHHFHVSCLLKAKQRNCMCPNCRTELTPLTEADKTELTGYAIDTSPIPVPVSRQLPAPTSRSVQIIPAVNESSISHAIVEAATRGRNAVR